jgi:hypothetical protein
MRERRKYPDYVYKSRSIYSRYVNKKSSELSLLKKHNDIKSIMGSDKYYRASDFTKKYNITRERVRQLKEAGRLQYKKIGKGYFYSSLKISAGGLQSKYERKYGINLKDLSKKFHCCNASLSKYLSSGGLLENFRPRKIGRPTIANS